MSTIKYRYRNLYCFNALVAEFIDFYGFRHTIFIYIITIMG